MTKIRITMVLADEVADPDHSTGLTNEAFEDIFGALSSFGYDIEIERLSD